MEPQQKALPGEVAANRQQPTNREGCRMTNPCTNGDERISG